jgi:hypothetical protein
MVKELRQGGANNLRAASGNQGQLLLPFKLGKVPEAD